MKTRKKAVTKKAIDWARRKRVTLLLPEFLDQNIEMYATYKGQLKTELICEALRSYLSDEGLTDPLSPPKDVWRLPSTPRVEQKDAEPIPA